MKFHYTPEESNDVVVTETTHHMCAQRHLNKRCRNKNEDDEYQDDSQLQEDTRDHHDD